jgi:outer membrane protein W
MIIRKLRIASSRVVTVVALAATAWFAYSADQPGVAGFPGVGQRDATPAERLTIPASSETVSELVDWSNIYEDFIKERLSVGFRVSHFALTKSRRPEDEQRELTFIGYVNELNEVDNNRLWPTVLYKFNQYFAAEFTMDAVTARTKNFNNHLSDGSVKVSGPIFNLFASYPFWDGRINPYVGIGIAPWSGTFKHDTWWMNGWSSPDDYAMAGSPKDSRRGYERRIKVSDDAGLVWTLGINARLHRHAELDLMVRWLDIDVDNEHGVLQNGVYDKKREGNFTMDHYALAGSIRFVF